MRIGEKEIHSIAEFVAAFYISFFVLFRPVSVVYSYRWSLILGLSLIILFLLTVMSTNFKLNVTLVKKLFILFVVVSIQFLLDSLFRNNEYIIDNFTGFILQGLIVGFFLTNISDYNALLKNWTLFATLSGIIYIPDPFRNYMISEGYMNFGSAILPAFAACVVSFFYYKKKLVAPLAVVFLLEIAIYANKGALVSAIALVIFFIVLNSDNNKERNKKLLFIIFLAGIALFFLSNILSLLVSIANKLGVASYSLTDLGQILNPNTKLSSYSVRNAIWGNVIQELKNSPIFGLGIGGFEAKYGNYAHNFFLDILISHGIIIGFCVFVVIIKMIKNTMCMVRINRDLFVFSFIMLLLWIFPSFFSFTYWKMNSFWIFIIVNLFNNAKYYCAKD